MDFLIVRTLLVSMGKNKSWYSNLILSVIIRKPKIRSNKFGIYPIKTSSYGHIQYEKKLPYGDFFLLWAMVLKNLDLFVLRMDIRESTDLAEFQVIFTQFIGCFQKISQQKN